MAAILSRPQYINSEIVISPPFPVPFWVKWIDQVELKYNRKPIHFSPTFFSVLSYFSSMLNYENNIYILAFRSLPQNTVSMPSHEKWFHIIVINLYLSMNK